MGNFLKGVGLVTIGFLAGRWTLMIATGINVHEAYKGGRDCISILDDYDNLGSEIENLSNNVDQLVSTIKGEK